jgi:predicted RNase H-like HicB family nuclease
MQYLVVVEEGSNSFARTFPTRLAARGKESKEESLTLIREAIEFHVESLKETGEPIPPPSSSSELVEVEPA